MSWHYLQGLEEVSSEAIFWDGEQFVPSSGQTTLGRYCLPDSETEFSHDSPSGTTCRHSTESRGEGGSMLSPVDSLARTSAQPEKAQESTAHVPECGSTWPGSFARFDRDSSLWRTPQCSLLEGLDVFLETWPRWGTMRNGECWVRETSVPRTNEIESGSWQTPCLPGNGGTNGKAKLKRMLLTTPLASIATHGGPNQRNSSGRPGLQMAAMSWATPTVNDAKNSTLPSSQAARDSVSNVMRWPTPRAGNPGSRPNGKGGKILAEEVKKLEESIPVGGQLNPTWVEWLMGWPIEWTDLKPLETDRFRLWRH